MSTYTLIQPPVYIQIQHLEYRQDLGDSGLQSHFCVVFDNTDSNPSEHIIVSIMQTEGWIINKQAPLHVYIKPRQCQ